MHGGANATAALRHFGKPVDGIGHPSALEALPPLDDALAPKSKGGEDEAIMATVARMAAMLSTHSDGRAFFP